MKNLLTIILAVISFATAFYFLLYAKNMPLNQIPFLSQSKISNDNPYTLIKLDFQTGARCLDGSPAAFYWKPGKQAGKFIIFFEGGAWCGDSTYDYTLNNCLGRSKGALGSSNQYKPTNNYQGILSNDPSTNPDFYDWSAIYVKYCDGTGHQGFSIDPYSYNGDLIYFRGSMNTEKTFQYALQKLGMDKAAQIIISGGSAGGLAAFTWAQYLADTMKQINNQTKVYAIPDSGLFLDFENAQTKQNGFRIGLQNFMEIANLYTNPPNKKCVQTYASDKWKCLFAQYSMDFIDIPVFIIESPYDSWSLPNIAGVTCIIDSGPLSGCNATEMQIINRYRDQALSVINHYLEKNPTWGAWGPSCVNHVYSQYDGRFNSPNFEVPAKSVFTLSQAIRDWINGEKSVHIEQNAWPSNLPCSGIPSNSQLLQ